MFVLGGDVGAAGTTASRRASVLVVDDDERLRRVFLAALRHGGYETLEATDGWAALELLEQRSVDLALVDMGMPGMSGVELASAIRRDPRHQAMGILFVSGDGALDSKLAGLDAGGNDYLVKPVELRELLARVAAQLRDRTQWLARLDQQLAARSQLARRIVELDRTVPLTVLERELLDVLTTELPLLELSVTAPEPTGSEHDETFAVLTPGAGTGSSVRVRVPLRFAGSLVGVIDVTVDHGAAQLAVSTLSDLAPQLGAVVADSVSRQSSARDARGWLDELLASGGLHPVYQPIVSLHDHAVVGYEGLSRFGDGTRPDIAFARASQAGFGAELETAAIERHLDAADALAPDTWLSLNVSAATLLAGAAEEQLGSAGRPLIIELTENEHVDDYAGVRDRLVDLPDVGLAVDDTGAGYASLRHIFELRPDLVKLDRSWCAGIDADPVRQALVHGLIGFSAAFDAQLVAEGVERELEAETLHQLGVPLAQGFLFGRPAPAR